MRTETRERGAAHVARQCTGWAGQERQFSQVDKVDLSHGYLDPVLHQWEYITPQTSTSVPSQNNHATLEHHRNPIPMDQLDSL